LNCQVNQGAASAPGPKGIPRIASRPDPVSIKVAGWRLSGLRGGFCGWFFKLRLLFLLRVCAGSQHNKGDQNNELTALYLHLPHPLFLWKKIPPLKDRREAC
jgi:hypothetical protein